MRKQLIKSALRLFATLLLLVSALAGFRLVEAQDHDLQYTKRGNYKEGIRATPVAGEQAFLELISFRADYREAMPAKGLPEQYKVRFLLEEPGAAFLTVRELRNVHYYWLGEVTPGQPWKKGVNDFAWPTGTVLSRLTPSLAVGDLGVVVRRDRAPASVERVAPAVLYHSRPPSLIEAYELWVVPSESARLEVAVLGPDGRPTRSSAEPQRIPRWSGGQALRIRWDARGAVAGRHTLRITGYVLSSNAPLELTVEFYHWPAAG